MIATRRHPPVPEYFAERFIADGWRGIERYYGARHDVELGWIAESGGLALLKARRGAYLQACREAARSGGMKPQPSAFRDYVPSVARREG